MEQVLLGFGALRIGRWSHRPSALGLVEYVGLRSAAGAIHRPTAAIVSVGSRTEVLRAVAGGEARRSNAPWGIVTVARDHLLRSAGAALDAPDDGEEVLYRGCTFTLNMPLSALPRSPLVESARLLGTLRSANSARSAWTTSRDYLLFDQQLELIVGLVDAKQAPLWEPANDAMVRLQKGAEGLAAPAPSPPPAVEPGAGSLVVPSA